MEKYEMPGEDKYRIYISEGTNNIKLSEKIKEMIEKSDKDFYVRFEYDAEGKINVIRIQGYTKIRMCRLQHEPRKMHRGGIFFVF